MANGGGLETHRLLGPPYFGRIGGVSVAWTCRVTDRHQSAGTFASRPLYITDWPRTAEPHADHVVIGASLVHFGAFSLLSVADSKLICKQP
jgi:hypothetical protein